MVISTAAFKTATVPQAAPHSSSRPAVKRQPGPLWYNTHKLVQAAVQTQPFFSRKPACYCGYESDCGQLLVTASPCSVWLRHPTSSVLLQAMTCTGKAAQTHKKHTTGKKHPAPDDDAERPSKAARTEPMGQWPGAAVSTEHPHTMSIVPQQQQGPQQQGVLVPQMQQVVPVGFEPLMPQPDPQKTRNQQQQEAFGLPLPPLCAAALAHAGLANGPGLPQQAQNDHASVAQGRQQQALDYDDLTAAHGSTTATDGLTSVQLQPDTPVAGGEVMEVVQVPDKGLQLPGSTYATTQMGTSAADKAQTATPIVCPTNERIMQFLFGTIAPGDEVVITALADAGPEINLGRVSLRVEQFLGWGGNAAAYLATVRHLTGSCLATSLAPDSVVVFKFPAVLHVMLADNLKPGDPDNARKVATIVEGSTDLVKQDYSIARRCSRCPHTVHAYGVGMLQLVNHPTLAQLPAQLLEDCNLGSWGDLLYPGGLLDSSLIKTDAHTVRHIMQQVLEALVFMAKNGMMHRDIKPDNIMFQGLSLGCCAVGAPPASSYPTLQQAYPFVAKVGDFDSACHSLTGIDSGKNVGTLTFQAPELACSGNNHHTATVRVQYCRHFLICMYSRHFCCISIIPGTPGVELVSMTSTQVQQSALTLLSVIIC